MSLLSEDIIRSAVQCSSLPIVFNDFVSNWPLCQWNVEKWCSVFGDKVLPFRCFTKYYLSDEPIWERKCNVKNKTFRSFIEELPTSTEWMYFDYKYVCQWFTANEDFSKSVSWEQFGCSDKSAADSTLWVGSCGAHTPAHQDTYGVNIVTQLYGKKRWLLFPPETGGLKPTRVPYEESSIYSELNFNCPIDLQVFNGVTGGHMVELSPGDALLVPNGWWHYVENLEPLNIALNIWLPHENDRSVRVSEALIKILIAQICKDLPEDTAKLVVNPNEDDISDTPLTVLFLQLETVAKSFLENRRKLRRAKRQRTCEDTAVSEQQFDLKTVLDNHANMQLVPSITSEELIALIKRNIDENMKSKGPLQDDEVDGALASLCLTKTVIDAFSETNVIDLVKQNLFKRLS